jgi:hypothetical protein
MKVSEIEKIIDGVQGWLTGREGLLLYNLARKCENIGVIVEIGSFQGRSTICLGRGSLDGGNIAIYAIDPHVGSPEHQKEDRKIWTFDMFKQNIKRVKVDNIVHPFVATSEDVAKDFSDKVQLIFIDGLHEYEAVKLDFDVWFPKVAVGGIMAFHDTMGWEGPRRVVEEHLFKSKFFKNVRFVDSITYGEKVEKNSFLDRLRNRYVLFLKNIHFHFGRLKLPKAIRLIGRKIIDMIQ